MRLENAQTRRLEGLYAITDTRLLPNEPALVEGVRAAVRGGARLIQYRDKENPFSRRVALASRLLEICRTEGAGLIINDDLALALKIQADGVHLGQQDGEIRKAREAGGEGFIVGATCHDRVDLAQRAESDGADYVAFGRFFPSHTKPEAPPASLDVLTEARSGLRVPIVAIGGINPDNAMLVLESGADLIAAIHGVFGQPDIFTAARTLAQLCARKQAHQDHRTVT